MYFWNIENLKKDITEGKLPEKDRFLYMLASLGLIAISMEIMSYNAIEDISYWDAINSIFNVLIILIGTVLSFNANGGSQGVDFLGKYISISFVMSIRFSVYIIPIFIMFYAYYFFEFSGEHPTTMAVDVIPFLLWSAALYWRIYFHIKQLNS
jgi:uncharacterized membrane-anchored protein YitT (DUF2179 family)